MNAVFLVVGLISLLIISIVAPDSAFAVMINGASEAISLSVKLVAIYSIWLSLLNLAEECGVTRFLNKLCTPVTKRLFKGENEKACEYISMNLSANLLGIGGAATPMGIKAIEQMNDGSGKATPNMTLFVVINATSIQLFSGTIIGLRSAAGSASASDIILPSLIATAVSTLIGIILCKVFCRK